MTDGQDAGLAGCEIDLDDQIGRRGTTLRSGRSRRGNGLVDLLDADGVGLQKLGRNVASDCRLGRGTAAFFSTGRRLPHQRPAVLCRHASRCHSLSFQRLGAIRFG
jgi:hypothetical protein